MRHRPASSARSGSPTAAPRWRSRRDSRTLCFGTGGSRRSWSAARRSSTSLRAITGGWNLLAEDLLERHLDSFAPVEGGTVPEDLRVELGVRHDLESRLDALNLVRTHKHRRGAAMFRDGHTLVAAADLVDETAEFRLRFGQRVGFHSDQYTDQSLLHQGRPRCRDGRPRRRRGTRPKSEAPARPGVATTAAHLHTSL